MRRTRSFISMLLVVVFLLASVSAFAAPSYSPYKNHVGNIGDSTHIWKYGYFDYVIGDGTNAYLRGFREVVTAKTSTYSVTAADCGKVFNNAGAATAIKFDLPIAASGLYYSFVVSTATSAYVRPALGEQIWGLTSAVNKSVYNSTKSTTLRLKAIGTGGWVVDTSYGTWTSE